MKNIIFDIGNVLLAFQPFEYLKQYYDEETMNDLMIIIFSSHEWVELDLGHMMIKDAKASLSEKHPQYKKEIYEVLDNWTDMLTPIKNNVEVVYKLKEKGYKLYLLSNFHKEAFDTVYKKYEFFSIFDGMVISADEHVIKPDDEIYKILLKKYHINPKESLFIDDMLGNIYTAALNLIRGIHLSYGKDLKKELKAIGIL